MKDNTIPNQKEIEEAVNSYIKPTLKGAVVYTTKDIKVLLDLAQAHLSGSLYMGEDEIANIIKGFIDVQNGTVTLPRAEINFTTEDISKALVGKVRRLHG